MRTPDLHPDELLDKASDGVLTEAERIQLNEHLSTCAVCRIEMQAQNDFQLELAQESNSLEIDDLVTRALIGAKTEPEPNVQRISERPRKKRFTMLVVAIAATFSAVGVAAAARITGVWQPSVDTEKAIDVPTSVPPLPIAPKRYRTARIEKADAAIDGVAEETEESVAQEPAHEAISAAIPAPESIASAPVHAPAPRVAKAHHEVPIETAVVDRDPPKATPSALFSDANAARVRGDHAVAISAYRALMHDFPNAPEARLSRITLGKLLLDRGDARSALDEIDIYLRSGDSTLREEALTAKAIAFSRIGNPSEESAAWSALVESYPHSIHIAKAKSRLMELNAH